MPIVIFLIGIAAGAAPPETVTRPAGMKWKSDWGLSPCRSTFPTLGSFIVSARALAKSSASAPWTVTSSAICFLQNSKE